MLWIEFANSLARDPLGRQPAADGLENPAWARRFANQWGLRPQRLNDERDRRQLRKLRSFLQRWAGSLAERRRPSPRDVRALNRYLSLRPLRPRITSDGERYQLELAIEASGVEAWLSSIAVSFARFLVEKDPSRLRLCDNPHCLWVFCDTTRSRTRRWCATSCGDLIKVREFRRRQLEE